MKLVLAEILMREMERRGLGLQCISEATGVPKSTLHDWTVGIRPYQADLVYKLAMLFKRDNESAKDAFFPPSLWGNRYESK